MTGICPKCDRRIGMRKGLIITHGIGWRCPGISQRPVPGTIYPAPEAARDATRDPETRFLELAAKPGMESLRRECPRQQHHFECRLCHPQSCPYGCQGRGWLRLPVPERLGALVEVAGKLGCQVRIYSTGLVELWGQSGYLESGFSDKAEESLTEAILASLEAAK